MFFWRRRHPIREEDLSAFVDGEMDPAARTRLEVHIEACAACRDALGELSELRRALRELPRASAPRSFTLREADVQPIAPQRSVGALGRTAPLLGGVATVAFLAFWALVGLDVASGPSGGAASDGAAGFLRDAGEVAEEYAATPVSPMLGAEVGAEPGDAEVAQEGEFATREKPAADEGMASAPPAPTPAARAVAEAEDDGRTSLRAAEAATAAVALVAGGSLALVWWRRRT